MRFHINFDHCWLNFFRVRHSMRLASSWLANNLYVRCCHLLGWTVHISVSETLKKPDKIHCFILQLITQTSQSQYDRMTFLGLGFVLKQMERKEWKYLGQNYSIFFFLNCKLRCNGLLSSGIKAELEEHEASLDYRLDLLYLNAKFQLMTK